MPADFKTIFPERELPSGRQLLQEGRALAPLWPVGRSAFLEHVAAKSEYEFKTRQMAAGKVMQHAQIGYREPAQSCRAYAEIWETCQRHGVTVDRYGLCLDWSMALPRAIRARATRGTGMILPEVEDFCRLTASAPAAPHFGDFVLGFPGALENTQAALAAGSTAIGNLGQYFTFRIPGHDDDVEATAATVRAIGLIAAQPVTVMVHSNIDDGYAAQFTDLTSCLGIILVERDLITRLAGAPIGHCFGHHFSDPMMRLAFHRAMSMAGASPGTVIYGNTTSYRGNVPQNFASLASYLTMDIVGQITHPTGHAINPVPVTENDRIPTIQEVIDAHLFAGRMKEHAAGYAPLVDAQARDAVAATILEGARRFQQNVMTGLAAAGVDTDDLFQMLLALRRIGPRRLESEYGAGCEDPLRPGVRIPVVPATILHEIREMADAAIEAAARLKALEPRVEPLKVLVATSDVHEHGKMLVEELLRRLSMTIEDGGVSTDPDKLVAIAQRTHPDVIAISTYNGVALGYFNRIKALLAQQGLDIPVLIGGRLNQIAEGAEGNLPTDVGDELAAAGAIVCREAFELIPALRAVAQRRQAQLRPATAAWHEV
ncbi:cobalamin-dependent protein [Ramlibacter albus]|uniref:Cobalamin B12-binding domain-containing protein n=1 Tax=Ramlibacter albus TaxID=2079448 RepID=A0A923MEI4_9BURK|nr:cobalamin-dependent protein [Ramlibacter albus]MBC5767819.1 cobalamin B12-binding domain-containing protein [Ramlibacter albus]